MYSIYQQVVNNVLYGEQCVVNTKLRLFYLAAHERGAQVALPGLQTGAGICPALVHAAQGLLQTPRGPSALRALISLTLLLTPLLLLLELLASQIQRQHHGLVVGKGLLHLLYRTRR